MKPLRIQRQRIRGWKAPPDAIYVGRPTVWGNPFRTRNGSKEASQEAVDRYRNAICGGGFIEDRIILERYVKVHGWEGGFDSTTPRSFLRGKSLMCWCPHDRPCHADVLLELANVEIKD